MPQVALGENYPTRRKTYPWDATPALVLDCSPRRRLHQRRGGQASPSLGRSRRESSTFSSPQNASVLADFAELRQIARHLRRRLDFAVLRPDGGALLLPRALPTQNWRPKARLDQNCGLFEVSEGKSESGDQVCEECQRGKRKLWKIILIHVGSHRQSWFLRPEKCHHGAT